MPWSQCTAAAREAEIKALTAESSPEAKAPRRALASVRLVPSPKCLRQGQNKKRRLSSTFSNCVAVLHHDPRRRFSALPANCCIWTAAELVCLPRRCGCSGSANADHLACLLVGAQTYSRSGTWPVAKPRSLPSFYHDALLQCSQRILRRRTLCETRRSQQRLAQGTLHQRSYVPRPPAYSLRGRAVAGAALLAQDKQLL